MSGDYKSMYLPHSELCIIHDQIKSSLRIEKSGRRLVYKNTLNNTGGDMLYFVQYKS